MSIIKGTNQVVAGFGGTKRSIGEVYFSQSALATDNSGALPLFTGETITSANTIYPEFYNWVTSHTELQCTSAEYETALSTYGECAKYVIGGGSLRLPLIKNYIKAANTAEGVKNIEAGLPNHKHFTTSPGGTSDTDVTILTAWSDSHNPSYTLQGTATVANKYKTSLATDDGGVYGKSNTVTPASTTLYPWVVAYAAAIPASTAQAAEFQQGLSGKADTNLGNITSLGKKSSVSWIMPDYSRSVSTGLEGHPTSESTNSYTCPTDGWILMHASKTTSGNTLQFYVNGNIKLQFPAFSASYSNIMYPVNKGDIIKLTTDSTSVTWFVSWCNFIPCKGA